MSLGHVNKVNEHIPANEGYTIVLLGHVNKVNEAHSTPANGGYKTVLLGHVDKSMKHVQLLPVKGTERCHYGHVNKVDEAHSTPTPANEGYKLYIVRT